MRSNHFKIFLFVIGQLVILPVSSQIQFNPHKKLLKSEIWERVSNLRFEDNYHYVAVEWQDDEYVLLDIGLNNMEIIRSKEYNVIHKKIKKITRKRFKPDDKLRIRDIWKRISMFRFECKGLNMAVEWVENEYILYPLEGKKKELFRSKVFNEIEKEIRKLTINQ